MNNDFPKTIDPGERILAVVGVRPLLTEEVERITRPMWDEINSLEFRVHRLAQQLARGELEADDTYPAVDYEPFLDAFASPPDPDQVAEMLDDVPFAACVPFLGTAAKAYNYLRDHFPISVERTVFGATNLPPSSLALGAFEDLLEVLDRPLAVFSMIAEGRFTSRQAAALNAVYPTLYAEVATAIVTATMFERGAHPDYAPDFGRGLSVLLGVPGLDPKIATNLAAPPPPKQNPPSRPTAKGTPQLVATKSDRLELEN